MHDMFTIHYLTSERKPGKVREKMVVNKLITLLYYTSSERRSGAVDRASDFGPRGPWFDSRPVHISLWP